jgi:chemotaxis protein MotB
MGCVTKGSYDEVVAERDTLRQTTAALETQVSDLNATNEDLSVMLAESEVETAELKGTYDSLVAGLTDEVASGQLTIAQLQSGGVQLNVGTELLFPSGSATLDPEGKKLLEKVASKLVEISNPIVVEGHTDDQQIGPSLKKKYETNWELAGTRAARIVRLLQEKGVAGERLRAVSSGPFHPVVPNDSDENRARNRRIEIRLLPEEEAGA